MPMQESIPEDRIIWVRSTSRANVAAQGMATQPGSTGQTGLSFSLVGRAVPAEDVIQIA